jgi:hypothetical protein
MSMPKEMTVRMGQLVFMEGSGRKNPNPMLCKEGRGLRNFACKHYDNCLDKAAKGMWSGFTCKQCDHFQHKEDSNILL